jgi:hypothetical protein
MNSNRPFAALVLAIFVVSPCARPGMAEEPDSHWIQLFNGRDLTGWTPKINGYDVGVNYADTFRVEDGVLKVCYDKYDSPYNDRVGYLFYDKPFSNYELRVEYRFVGEQLAGGPDWAWRNSGIMLHGPAPAAMLKDQGWLPSIEVQLLGGDGKKPRPTANLCTPGTNVVMNGRLHTQHCTNSTSDTYHGDQWVTVEVEVHGNKRIRHKMGGRTVLEYTQPQLDPNDQVARRLLDAGAEKMLSGGTISLQSESHPVEFRKVELRELTE